MAAMAERNFGGSRQIPDCCFASPTRIKKQRGWGWGGGGGEVGADTSVSTIIASGNSGCYTPIPPMLRSPEDDVLSLVASDTEIEMDQPNRGEIYTSAPSILWLPPQLNKLYSKRTLGNPKYEG